MAKPVTTPFQDRVYDLLCAVPRGRVTTYGRLAQALGTSPRSVGQALRNNPFAPDVPCHRVIAADMTIGGFGGETEGRKIALKLQRLADEGVSFAGGRLADPRCLYDFRSSDS